MTRDELIDAGARAIMGPAEPAPGEMDGCRSLAEDILDVVAPLMLADLRTKVEALPAQGASDGAWVNRADVLNLLDGAP